MSSRAAPATTAPHPPEPAVSGFLSLDLLGRVRFLDGGAARLLGVGREEGMGRQLGELLAEADSAACVEALAQSQARGQGVSFALRGTRGASLLPAHLVCRDGEVSLFLGAVAHGAAMQLESSVRLRTLLDVAHSAVVLLASDGTVLHWNPAAERVLRTPQARAVGQDFAGRFCAPEHREVFRRELTQVLAGAMTEAFEVDALRGDGSRATLRWDLRRFAGSPDMPAGLVAVGQDVTERRNAERILRENEERLVRTLEATGEAPWDWDLPSGRVTVDARWGQLLGDTVPLHPLESQPPESPEARLRVLDISAYCERVHPEDLEAFERALADHLEGRTASFEIRHRLRTPDGGWQWMYDRGKVIARDAQGRPTRMVGTVADVTARWEMEERLRASEERLRLALEAAELGTFEVTATPAFSMCSARMRELFGLPPEGQVELHELVLRIHPEDRERALARAREAVRSRQGLEDEYRVVRPDGTIRRAAILARIVPQTPQAPWRMVGVITDVTERRRAEEELRQSESRLAGIIGSAMDAILAVDGEGRVTLFNAAAERMFRCPAAEALGGPVSRFLPDEGARGEGAEGTPQAPGVPRSLVGRRADGTRFPIEATVSTSATRGELLATLILRDASERQQLEAQLRQAQKMEAVGRLAGGVAHDFNNMLTAVITNLQMARRDLPADTLAHEDVSEALKASQRAAALTRQLLTFSRKQSVQQVKVLDVNAHVAAAERMLRRVVDEAVVLSTVLSPGVGAVRMDPSHLDQMLMNLVVNARDAMPRGGRLTIETGSLELGRAAAQALGVSGPGSYFTLSVHDTGVGMDESTRVRLFDPFFTTKPVNEGTGLGLAVVYGIVTGAGGAVRVESAPGRGSTFTVFLPRVDAPVEGPVWAPGAVAVRGREMVLLVEDEAPVRSASRRLLERHGYRVLEARHGLDALEVWRSHREDVRLVLTDVRMPTMGGRELVEQLRQEAPGLRVLFISGYTDADQREGDTVLDGAPLLAKPFDSEDLLKAVRRVLDA